MEFQPPAMEKYFIDESLDVSESVGLFFDCLYFVVYAFARGVGHSVFEVVDDAWQV